MANTSKLASKKGIRLKGESTYRRVYTVVLFLVENTNKMISDYLSSSLFIILMILFLSFCADRDNRPPNGLTCFLDVIFVYVLKVMTVTRYDLILIKDLLAARKKLIFNIFLKHLISIV
jgi:hypothetical protein